jgi:hypothetical protein
MSVRSVRQVLIVALGVFSSSIAFARNPPALVEQQKASEHARESGGGYRDINLRYGNVPARSPQLLSASGGYRDMNHRFPTGSVN